MNIVVSDGLCVVLIAAALVGTQLAIKRHERSARRALLALRPPWPPEALVPALRQTGVSDEATWSACRAVADLLHVAPGQLRPSDVLSSLHGLSLRDVHWVGLPTDVTDLCEVLASATRTGAADVQELEDFTVAEAVSLLASARRDYGE